MIFLHINFYILFILHLIYSSSRNTREQVLNNAVRRAASSLTVFAAELFDQIRDTQEVKVIRGLFHTGGCSQDIRIEI